MLVSERAGGAPSASRVLELLCLLWLAGMAMRVGDGAVATPARAAVVVAAYTLGLFPIATVAFRARDVQ